MTEELADIKKFKILVVDDDRAMRLVLRHVLEKEGYEIAEAADGVEALRAYRDLKPDIVLMDCMMSVLDGFTACARLNELSGGSTPVLMLTGLNDDRSVELAFESGAADFITKPINWSVLRQRVSRLLRARRTEELLDKSEASAKSIISHSLDGIITINRDGIIKSFNPAAERIFGYKSYEVADHDIRMLIPAAFRGEGAKDEVDRITPQCSTQSLDLNIRGRRKDGSFFPLELTISGFVTGNRLITVRDITDLKVAEEKLRMAAKVFESTTEGIIVMDTDGSALSVNNAFTVITGYSPEEAIGKNLWLLRTNQHDQEFYKNMRESLMKTGQWQGQIWNRRKNGEVFPAWLSISAIKDDHGKTSQYAAVFSDITEQVRLMEEKQRLMEQAARAQKLASLGTISAGIAHEINQPLNSIKVIVDGMLYWNKKGKFPDQEKVIENLQKISARAGRIDEIIKHMRSFVSVGRSARLELCQINDAVNGALSMLGHQLSSHGIIIKKVLPENLPPVLANGNKLEAVMVNLLVNAMQALDTVNRPDKEIICRALLDRDMVVMEVSDNATGICEEIKSSIFDPFFSTKQAGDGMGLGLSIVQTIVSGFNGEIRAGNNERGGATFRLEFPAAENAGGKKDCSYSC